MPTATFQPYGVAKAAQDKLTQDLAFEFASKGVRVNSILPGDSTIVFISQFHGRGSFSLFRYECLILESL